jgi:hypothetical protein
VGARDNEEDDDALLEHVESLLAQSRALSIEHHNLLVRLDELTLELLRRTDESQGLY